MAKRILSTLAQFIAFCALFYVGGFWAVIRLALEMRAMERGVATPPMIGLWKVHVNPTLDYIANGLVFAGVLLVLILLVQALRKRLRTSALWTLGAFLLAFALSLILHSGFVPVTPAS